ncbi:protein 5NUC-like [Scaptodrosophila lebanonensis]|uniref:5'-nucleotidase n=1 Tax=Drosophila lebanonensis TaxID=7225 RepID=A0A6J2TX31_DROLE|nr:protein 5NUC-like [Scaptodrosophila lebanonensis]
MLYRWTFLISTLLLSASISANPISKRSTVATEFIILHNNDMHARFEQTNVNSGPCSTEEANTDKCYGGFARVAYEVRKYRAEAQNGGTPVFYLNAGDTYTGTPWFTVFKDNITTAFLNKLMPDAISLGNHEFDKNVEGLIPFLNNVEFPVLACNLNLTKVPELAATKHLVSSTLLETNGVKIGVVGYLTPDTKFLTYKNDVEYLDEIVAINAETAKLKEQGIKIIIALGHSGYKRDQEIAKNCLDVDIVIGGHSHSFLFGDQPVDETEDEGSNETSEVIRGPYPTVVQQGGKRVPVVQAYAYTKYLGKLHVQFDEDGNLIEFDGAPILLNASVTQEAELLQLLDVYRPTIEALDTDPVGYTKVKLVGGEYCRKFECNLGNLIADSMIFARVLENAGGDYWTDASIALIQGGGIRSGIDKNAEGSIVGTNILTVLPFENALHVTKISGKTLLNALEHSAAVRSQDSNGGFLQYSGVRVEYNYENPDGQRVLSAEVRCAQCEVPSYSILNETDYYNVIVTDFLLEGGDDFILTEEDNPGTILMEKNDQQALIQYLEQRHYVYPEVEGRITYQSPSPPSTDDAASVIASIGLLLISFLVTRIFM